MNECNDLKGYIGLLKERITYCEAEIGFFSGLLKRNLPKKEIRQNSLNIIANLRELRQSLSATINNVQLEIAKIEFKNKQDPKELSYDESRDFYQKG